MILVKLCTVKHVFQRVTLAGQCSKGGGIGIISINAIKCVVAPLLLTSPSLNKEFSTHFNSAVNMPKNTAAKPK